MAAALLGPAAGHVDGTVQQLAAGFVREAGHQVAASTAREYHAPWRAFVSWWRARGLPGTVFDTPPSLVGLYLYSVYLSAAAAGVGPGRVRAASAAIHHYFSAAGQPSPTGNAVCSSVRALAARELAPRPFQRDALTVGDLQRLVARFAGPGAALLDLMMCAAISLMFFAFLRFDDMSEVGVHRDLLVLTDSHLEVFLPRSKTDQVWQGSWVVVGRLEGAHCPVALVSRLLESGGYRRDPSSPAEDVGPLLRTVQRTGAGGRLQHVVGTVRDPVRSMGYSAFKERLQRMCTEAGITSRILPHSMRIGGNSAAEARGVPAELRMAHGRWLSGRTLAGYTRRAPDAAIELTRRVGLP